MVSFMTEGEMRTKAPAAFATEPYSKVSDRYGFVPTHEIIEKMADLGWGVRDIGQIQLTKRVLEREDNINGFQHHTVIFHNKDDSIIPVDGLFPEIALKNNHSAHGSFKFMSGIFRMACSNGLIVPDKSFVDYTQSHFKIHSDEIQKLVDKTIEITSQLSFDRFMKPLDMRERKKFAKKALELRFSKRSIQGIDIDEVLTPVRSEDEAPVLWNVFNTLQEKLIKGGILIHRENISEFKHNSTTPSKSLSLTGSNKINMELWELMNSFANVA